MRLLVVVLMLVTTRPALAQNVPCGYGNYLPCGVLPWPLPSWPVLLSPTPRPDQWGAPVITPTPTATFTPTPTPTVTNTPTITPTAPFDPTSVGNAAATLSAVMSGTDIPVLNALGTPINSDTELQNISTSAGDFFGYIRGLTAGTFGAFTPLITFSLTALGITLTVKLAAIGLPIILAIYGFIRKLIVAILEFIPF